MKASEKVKGIVFDYNTDDTPEEFAMVRELGVDCMRMLLALPWKDRMYGELTEQYISDRESIRKAYAQGFKVMPATPSICSFTYDEEAQETLWHEHFPDFMGEKGTEEFYENVRKTLCFMAEDLGEAAGPYWQCMNEIDNPVFTNRYSDEVVAKIARACADGVVRANPDAKCGINVTMEACTPRIVELAYAEGHNFGYLGVDQYFGCWQRGTIERWNEIIDELYENYKMPVMINEWGYSSGGEFSAERPDPKDVPHGFPDVCVVKKWFDQEEGGHTPEVQARIFKRGHQIFAENPHCIGSFMFCWRDAYFCYHCGAPDCPAECYWGLVTSDCVPKPAYYAVKEAIKECYRDE